MGFSTTSSGGTRAPIDLVEGGARRSEVQGIVSAAFALLLILSLGSHDVQGGGDWIGPAGSAVAGVLASALGVLAWWIPIELSLLSIRLFRGERPAYGLTRALSSLVVLVIGSALIHLSLADRPVFGGYMAGGLLGELIGEVLRASLGVAGANIVGIAALLVTLVLRTSVSVVRVAERGFVFGRRVGGKSWTGLREVVAAWRDARRIEREEREAREAEEAPRIVTLVDEEAPHVKGSRRKKADAPGDLRSTTAKGRAAPAFDEEAFAKDTLKTGSTANDNDIDLPASDDLLASESDVTDGEASVPGTVSAPADASTKKVKPAKKGGAPVIVAPTVSIDGKRSTHEARKARTADGSPFVLPPTTLLDAPSDAAIRIDERGLKENAIRLVEKLQAYGVEGRVDEIHPGPVVTMYELEPASGTKLSKIASLSDDLAMALAADKVRIVAPIPGKARVGFELPNKHRSTVSLRDILEADSWRGSQAALPLAIGKDIAGQPYFVDLARMPHLLVAGATGTGKSVGLNVMLTSLLSKRSPEELRLLMIDPKVVELRTYDGIPHMLLPVVTDMQKASLALRWAVDEMERRYQLFADAGARNITTYNERVERVLRGEMPIERLMPSKVGMLRAIGPDGGEVLVPPTHGDETGDSPAKAVKLPYVVVVVDEFADLMMTAAKDVEAAIARLAQKARAAGIHVILATQRPSVDVITGMIKANFPARIAYKVSQREDSKTILGRNGAEHLLGMGDMLMIPPGSSDLKRVHGAYISEDEVGKVCDFLRAQGSPVYDEDILKPRDDDQGLTPSGMPASDDPLFDKAVQVVATAGYCSISHLQRQLGLGYNKAAKLVERMEAEGVVGPASAKAGGRREVLIGQTL